MASPTTPLLHGYLNSTHTSNLTSFYPPQNLPTPWPLVAASLVISLTLCCYSIKGAFVSWTKAGQNRRRGLAPGVRKSWLQTWLQTFRERHANYRAGIGRPLKGKKMLHPVVHDSELEDLHKPDEAHAHHSLNDDSISSYEGEHHIDLRHKLGIDDDDITFKGNAEDDDISKHKHNLDDGDITYKGKRFDDDDGASKYTTTDPFGDSEAATLHESIREVPKSPKWQDTPLKKVIVIIICAYSTFRAITGFTIALAGLINYTTPPPAPSILLLLLLSIQIPLSNRSLPRLMTLIYTTAALLTTLAFLIVSYMPLSSLSLVPKYASLSIRGGNCPVAASDCHSQTTHWSVVGCANYTYYTDLEDSDSDEIPEAQFYPPYATHSDVNQNTSNALLTVETVILAFGTLWLLSVLLHLWEARHLFVHPVLSNLLRPQPPVPQTGRSRGRTGAACTGIVTLLGIVGAVVAAVMSFAAHVSQATGTPGHAVTYIDSLGPGTWANFTEDSTGYVVGTDYWGNATDWNDCFTVVSPTVGTGWAEWAGQNGGWEWVRVVAGL
jgi:hypothetical protein